MIVAHEWYREYFEARKTPQTRDYEADAEGAFEPEEKIYE